MKDAPAKGEKSCVISQLTSEFLERRKDELHANSRVKFYVQTMSSLKFSVKRNGSIAVSVVEDKYPGTRVYFMVDGKRYVGDAGYQLPLDSHALTALKQEKQVDFTYTAWPDRNEISRQDVFSDFAKAHTDCVEYLGGKVAPSKKAKSDAETKPLDLSPKNQLR